MNKTQNLQMKLTFLVFAFILALVSSGAAFAIAAAQEPTTSSYVVETETTFYGPSVIQDAINDDTTVNGHHVQIQASEYFEQFTVTKNLTIAGTGSSPEETVIISGGEEGTVIIPAGVTAVLENLSIWNMGEGQPIVNNGQLTIINCIINGNYVANEFTGAAGETTETITANTEVMLMASEEGTTEVTGTSGTTEGTTEVMDETPTTTETNTDNTGEAGTTTNSDPAIPLASLASGMLMVMGGTVVSGRKHP